MAVIEFLDTSVAATVEYTGFCNNTLTAGQTLKIESSPDGEEILNVEVPAGKTWQVYTYVRIVET